MFYFEVTYPEDRAHGLRFIDAHGHLMEETSNAESCYIPLHPRNVREYGTHYEDFKKIYTRSYVYSLLTNIFLYEKYTSYFTTMDTASLNRVIPLFEEGHAKWEDFPFYSFSNDDGVIVVKAGDNELFLEDILGTDYTFQLYKSSSNILNPVEYAKYHQCLSSIFDPEYSEALLSVTDTESIEIYSKGRNSGFFFKQTNPAKDLARKLNKVFNYSANPMKYIPYTVRTEKDQANTPLYGVEIECSTNLTVQSLVKCQEEVPFFIAKSDSSIQSSTHSTGMELVTIPMTYKAQKIAWGKFFKRFDKGAFDVSRYTGNGMHVHVDRKAFLSRKHREAFIWFFSNPEHYPYITNISERVADDINRWARFPYSSVYNTTDDAYNKFCNCRYTVENMGKYCVINLSKSATIEIRVFKGIISYASILKNLDFVDAVFNFTAENNTFKTCTLQNFYNWLSQTRRNQYRMLKKFMEEFEESFKSCLEYAKSNCRATADNIHINIQGYDESPICDYDEEAMKSYSYIAYENLKQKLVTKSIEGIY